MSNHDPIDQNLFSSLKNKLIETLKSDNEVHTTHNSELECINETVTLKEAYYSLLYAVLDPSSHLRKNHNFQKKMFGKPTNCELCGAIMWGDLNFCYKK